MIYDMQRMIIFLEDQKNAMYTPEAIFSLPWTKKPAYVEFTLPKVSLTYRIFEERPDRYRIMIKFAKEKAWKFGYTQSLTEAKYRIFYHIITFRLYVTGKWEVPGEPSTLYERWRRALYHMYPSEFLDIFDLDAYHNQKTSDGYVVPKRKKK